MGRGGSWAVFEGMGGWIGFGEEANFREGNSFFFFLTHGRRGWWRGYGLSEQLIVVDVDVDASARPRRVSVRGVCLMLSIWGMDMSRWKYIKWQGIMR